MTDYVPPDTSMAEKVRLAAAEAEAERRWLDQVATEQLERIAYDKSEPAAARQNAMAVLLARLRKLPDSLERLTGLLEPLVDDPDPDVATMALRHYPMADQRAAARVRQLLDSAQDRVRAEAAVALARIGDPGILQRLLAWLASDREAERGAAIEGLVALNAPEARETLAEQWQQGGRNRGDRVVLSVALLRLGDLRALAYLETVAEEAKGAWSVTAATWIYYHQRVRGLRLMQDILDHGDLESRQSMVMQIANFARLPHVFTSEGLREAKSWIKRQVNPRRRRRRRGR